MSSSTPKRLGGKRGRRMQSKSAGQKSAEAPNHTRPTNRTFEAVKADSSLSSSNLPKLQRFKKPRVLSFPETSPPEAQESPPEPEESVDNFVLPLQEDSEKAEGRWRAVCIVLVREEKHKRKLTREEFGILAGECSVGSGRILERYVSQVRNGKSLKPKKPSGRRPTVLDQVADFMAQTAAEFKFAFTAEVMAAKVRDELKIGSSSTVLRVLKKKNWTKTRQTSRPYLTPANQAARMTFCRQWLHIQASNLFWRVHIDEKWFFAFPKGRVLYCPPGVTPPVQKLTHKNHIPKVMFLASLGEPTPLFDGSLGIWPVASMYTPKKASKYHPKVNGQYVPYLKLCTMDTKFFIEMVDTKVIPAIVSRSQAVIDANPDSLLTVYVQLDNAGGHGVASSVDILNKIGEKAHPRLRIHFHCQPPNSPDLNVLDLGAWHSIQKAVPRLVHDPSIPKGSIEDRIMKIVPETFSKWNAQQKCTDLFETLRAFQCEVIESNGVNTFKQPHTNHLKMRIASLKSTELPLPSLPDILRPQLPAGSSATTPVTLQ